MNKTTKILILAAASEPSSGIDFDGDLIVYNEKKYWVDLSREEVRFVGECKGREDGVVHDR